MEAIATGLVSGNDAIKEYVRCTLLYLTVDKKVAYGIMGSALQELATEGLVQLNDDESYSSTQLGQAVVASAFAPEDGLFVFEELKRALQAFVMDGDMHIFYLFTPLQAATATPIDWLIFRDQLDNLDESGLRALQFVGVSPGFVNTMYAGSQPLRSFMKALMVPQGTKWCITQGEYARTDEPGQDIPQSVHGISTSGLE